MKSLPEPIGFSVPPRLIVIGCSAHKRPDAGELPAIERYAGPSFGVLRKFLRIGGNSVRICIVSARFGLIDAETPLPYYDERMTVPRARKLHKNVLKSFSEIIQLETFEGTFFNLGRDYWPALEGWHAIIPPTMRIVTAQGSSGRRAALMHEWLNGGIEDATPFICAPHDVHLGGLTWHLTREEILTIARQRLRDCDIAKNSAPSQFHSWRAVVDGRSVAPKWLVSQITGLPVSAFHTEQACRALTRWGILVERQSLLDVASENFKKNISEV
jgi:hypothetical protein